VVRPLFASIVVSLLLQGWMSAVGEGSAPGVPGPRPLSPGNAQSTPDGLIALPTVDEHALSGEQRALWIDVRERFRAVSARVHEARILLQDLEVRLQRQDLMMNAQYAAGAVRMQDFLEDAVELIRTGDFESAKQALVRADYERRKLKNVTGQ
jgi:hypothetical protein